jgi:hypothetical protein
VFDVLVKFELAVMDDSANKKSGVFWAAEAMGWVATHGHVTGSTLETLASAVESEKIQFSLLFACCVFPQKISAFSSTSGLRIYFSDSSRTRRDVLVHVFRPLLGDIFSLNVVYHVFDALGIRDDTNYILQCFGEWFMLLSKKEIYNSLLASNPPMTRFLRDLVSRQLRNKDETGSDIALATLHSFCKESSDLVRAFLLAAFCREAVARASVQREKASYGEVLSRKLVGDWDTLLRKLRVCLLVAFRLTGAKLQAPITIAHVEEGDIFSVYEWLARDELSMSHDQEEISLLEKACSISSHAFDPSTPEGDGPTKFKILQSSCLASQISEAERAEYLVDFDDDDRFGALLLFIRSHNEPSMLAAHRALLLSSEWVQAPQNINCLHDSFMALDALYSGKNNRLTAAVCLYIWKLCAAVFRAHLFGWDDIQEINEGVFAPLLQTKEWLVPFGRMALKFLRILRVIDFDLISSDDFETDPINEGSSWPPVRPDFILNRLVTRVYAMDESAVDTHCVVVCALLVSSDIAALVKCVPAIYDCFMPSSLGIPIHSAPNVASLQYNFVEEAIMTRATTCPNKPLEHFSLQEIETLAHVWGIETKSIRSQFLLAMYELEKDLAVDDILIRDPSHIDVRKFVEHGVDIACRRLGAFLNGERMDSTVRRNVMGRLDADLCGWVQQRAKESQWLVNVNPSEIPIERTEILIMRLVSLSAGANIDSALRTKIHLLAVLSGTLVKELSGYGGYRR